MAKPWTYYLSRLLNGPVSLPCFVLLVLLMATAKKLAVKAGTSIDSACLSCCGLVVGVCQKCSFWSGLFWTYVPSFRRYLWMEQLWAQSAGDKGLSKKKSKQQSPCINCMHWPVMSWYNACSTCMHKPVSACIGLWCHRPMHALTAGELKFQVGLRYTFTPATLLWALIAAEKVLPICFHLPWLGLPFGCQFNI